MTSWQQGRPVVILSGGPRSRFTYYADELSDAVRAEYVETDRYKAIGEVYERTPGSPAALQDVVCRVWERRKPA